VIDLATRSEVTAEDAMRASAYALLAGFLARPPAAGLLSATAAIVPDPATTIGRALADVALACAGTTAEQAVNEYHDLFIGLARGELVPYASYYLTGFLYDRPLQKVRADLARLGVERAADVAEPEDHVAVLCETMAGLATGAFGAAAPLAAQRTFFETHLAPWAPRFFEDLETARSAALYRPLGTFGRQFMGFERDGFLMTA
jgi:TorA maturation chaperone TorD